MIDWQKIHGLLEDVTPLRVDCGQLCDSVCCKEWDQGVGMYLLPGEEVMFTGQEDWIEWEEHDTADYEFCPSWQGKVKFLRCKGHCPRSNRPLACRVFPLMPYLTPQGQLQLRFDRELGQICPLIKAQDMGLLDKKFISRVKQVYLELLTDERIRADIEWQSRQLDEQQEQPWYQLFK